jgi:hypothetical protein
MNNDLTTLSDKDLMLAYTIKLNEVYEANRAVKEIEKEIVRRGKAELDCCHDNGYKGRTEDNER